MYVWYWTEQFPVDYPAYGIFALGAWEITGGILSDCCWRIPNGIGDWSTDD